MNKYYGYSHKSTEMNDWIRLNCKDTTEGLTVTDLDFIFYDFKLKRMKLIEVKTFGAKIKDWQLKLYQALDLALKNNSDKDFLYDGFYLLTLDTDNPETSDKILLNETQITKEQLIDFLDFKLNF